MSGFVPDILRRPLQERRDRYEKHLQSLIFPDCASVLDIGCGTKGSLLTRVPGIPRSVGVDLKTPEPHDDPLGTTRHDEYHQRDVRTIAEYFPANSFDCIVALDLIEHLDKTEGVDLLCAMERIASKRVIVFTPNGFLHQPPGIDNPFQEHLSGWTVADSTERGY